MNEEEQLAISRLTNPQGVVKVENNAQIQAESRAELDTAIVTAHQYPRDLKNVLNTIETLATLDQDTANECFYLLRRNGANGGTTIEGASVRLAEIVSQAWGNLNIGTRIVANDGRTITVQGVIHDLESNIKYSCEVKRSIVNKYGQTFSQDMQVVTSQAASAIAFRNCVFKIVPKAYLKKVFADVKDVAMGKSLDMESSRQAETTYFTKLGVTTEQLLQFCKKTTLDDIDKNDIFELRGAANALKEGDTTIVELFGKPAAGDEKKDDKDIASLENKAEAAAAASVSRIKNSLRAKQEPSAQGNTETK